MDAAIATGFLEDVNERIDPALLIRYIGYATDKIQVAGDSVKCFCPIHKDSKFRSLLLDRRKHTFKCTIKTCAGYRGGTLVELVAITKGIDPLAAAAEIAGALDVAVDPAWYERLSDGFYAQACEAETEGGAEAALAAAQQALRFRPDHSDARLLIARVSAVAGDTVRSRDEFVAVAEHLLAAQSFEEAGRVLAEAETLVPGDEDLLFLKARCAEEQGRRDEALALLEQLASRREKDGRTADTVGLITKLIELQPDEPSLHVRLAGAHEARNDLRSASVSLREAADMLTSQGRGAEVIPLLEKVIHYDPSQLKIRTALADALLSEGDYERAKAHIFESVDLMVERSDFALAAETVRKWLDVEPESMEAHTSLARIYLEMGDATESAAQLRRCAALEIKQGNTASALEFLNRAKFQVPDNWEIRADIVGLLRETDQNERAGFELLDVAEIHFIQERTADGAQALAEAAALGDTPVFQIQVAAAMRAHDMPDQAAGILAAAANQTQAAGDAATAIECLTGYVECVPGDLAAAHRRCMMMWDTDMAAEALAETPELAEKLLDAGDPAPAAELLRTAVERTEDTKGEARRRLLGLCARAGERDAALALYPAATKELRRKKNWGELLAAAQELLAVAPDHEPALCDSADALAKTGNNTEAVEYQTRVAIGRERGGYPDGALKALNAALKISPEREDVARHKAAVLKAIGRDKDSRAVWADLLDKYRDSGDPAAVIAGLDEYLGIFPGDARARRDLADTLAREGRKDEAMTQFALLLDDARQRDAVDEAMALRERMVELDPENPRVRLELAASCRAAGDTARALEIYLAVADKCLEASDFGEAVGALRGACELRPEDAGLLERLARAEYARGNRAGLDECLDRLLATGHTDFATECFREQISQALATGRHKDAQEQAQRWLLFVPGHPEALEQTGEAYLLQNRTQRAVEMFLAAAEAVRGSDTPRAVADLRRALAAEPDNVQVRQTLAQVLLDAGAEDEAVVEMQQAADTLIERRAYKEAVKVLARILEYRTSSVDTLRRLASLVHEHEGYAKALPHFRKLLAVRAETDPPGEVAKEYEAILRLEGADIGLRSEYATFLSGAGDQQGAKRQMLQVAQAYRDEYSDPVRAIESFGRATSLVPEPTDGRIFEEVADLHLSLNVPDFAAEALREAVRLHEACGDMPRALAGLESLVALPGPHARDHAHAGSLAQRMGRTDESVAHYRAAIGSAGEPGAAANAERLRWCEELLAQEPDDLDCMMTLLDLMPDDDRAARAMELQARFALNGMPRERALLLERAKDAAPDRLDIRRELVSTWRETGSADKLFAELLALCARQCDAGDMAEARTGLDELADLATGATDIEAIAGLLARCGEMEAAVKRYCEAAQSHLHDGRTAQAGAALDAAAAAGLAHMSSAAVSAMYRNSGGAPELRPAMRQLLDHALAYRSRTPALLTASALLEHCTEGEVDDLLQHVADSAGGQLAISIGGAHVDWLLEHATPGEAVRVVHRVTSIAQDMPEAWWLAAQVHRKLNDKKSAAEASLKAARLFSQAGAVTEEETCYRDALEEFPDDKGVLETLAFFYERERRTQEAVEMMRRLAALAAKEEDPDAAAKWLGRLVEHAAADVPAREQLVEQLLALGRPGDAVANQVELARLLRTEGNTEAAVRAFERALEIDPKHAEALGTLLDLARDSGDTERLARFSHALADIRAAEGDPKRASQILSALLETDPGNIEALEKLAQWSATAGDEKARIRTLDALGHKLAKTGDHARAAAHFEALLELKPGDRNLLEMLMHCCSAAGMKPRALEHGARLLDMARLAGEPGRLRSAAEAVLELDEEDPQAHRDLAASLVKLGEPADGLSHWGRAAELYSARRDFGHAAECLALVTQHDPDNRAAWHSYADILASRGDTDGAREALLRLAESHARAGNEHEVERLVNKAIESSPPQDIQTHERVLAIHRVDGNPDNILADLVWLASHYLRAENYKRAEPMVEEGLAIDPEDVGLRDCRLVLLRRTGRTEELQLRLRELADQMIEMGDLRHAADYLKEFADNNPERTDVRRELADVLRRLGEDARACEEELKSVGDLLARDETEAARELADSLIEARPGEIALRERVACIFLEHRLPDAAARHFVACAALAAKAGDGDGQIRHLRSAAEARPRAPEPLRQLADAYTAAGRLEEGSEALGRLTDLLVDLRSFGQAVEAMRRRVSASPNDASLRRQLVDLFERMGNKEGRIAETQNLADLLLSQGRIDEATAEYRSLVFLKPDDIAYLRKYIELFEQLGSEQELVDDYLRLADLHAQRGQYAEATQTFERAMAIDRRATVARERFIVFLQNCGQKPRALAEMARLAEQYATAGRTADATRVLEEAHKLNPQDTGVLLALARLLALSPPSSAAAGEHFESAATLLADRDPAGALEAMRAAVAAAPSRLDLRQRLALMLERAQDLRALAANARAMAELCAAQGDQKAAAQHRQKAAELAPRMIETLRARIAAGGDDARRDDLVELGDILAERGDVDEAISMYRAARAIRDDSPDLIRKCIDCVAMIAPEHEAIPDLLALGALQAKAGQDRKANETYERVLALDPHNDAAKAGLGIGSKPRARRPKPGSY